MSDTITCPTMDGDVYVTTYCGPEYAEVPRKRIQLTIDDSYRSLNTEEAKRVANLLRAAAES